MSGGGQHESANKAAKAFVARAKDFVPQMNVTAVYPLPMEGNVRFFVITTSGIFSVEAKENDLGYNKNPLSPLFHEGHKVITELRLISQEAKAIGWFEHHPIRVMDNSIKFPN